MHVRKRWIARLTASVTAVGLTVGLTAVSAAPASAYGGSATDWMSGKFGVMEHYLASTDAFGNNGPSLAAWNAQVNAYDVNGVAAQVKAAGASWMQIAVGQNNGYYDAPNATLTAYVPPTASFPSRISDRDLVKDLGNALHAQGLKAFAYVTSDEIKYYDRQRSLLGGDVTDPSDKPNAAYEANWTNVLRNWAQGWGTSIDGFWVDGAFWGDLGSYYDGISSALRSGNPNALIAHNPGRDDGYNRDFAPETGITTDDYTAGEMEPQDFPGRFPITRFKSWNGVNLQRYYLCFSQTNWGAQPTDPMSLSNAQLATYTKKVTDVGAALTWDVGFDRANGHISSAAMQALTAAGMQVGSIANLSTTVFVDGAYSGTSANLVPGSYTSAQLSAVGISGNSISSIGVPHGYQVTAYSGTNLSGSSWTYTADTDLVGTSVNDAINSLKVTFNANQQFNLINVTNNLLVDGRGSTTNGSVAGQWTPENSQNLEWRAVDQGNGYYQIVNHATGLALDGAGAATNGAQVKQWAQVSSQNLEWQITDTGHGWYKIANHASGLVLNGGGNPAAGTDLTQWSWVNGTTNLVFTLQPVN